MLFKNYCQTKMVISEIYRYLFFIGHLLANTIIPSSFRGAYLWAGTIFSLSFCMIENRLSGGLFFTALGGLGHSVVHILWPFLDEKLGYVPSVSALPDVMFHSAMIIFVWYKMRRYISRELNIITKLCIFGSILNCIFTNFGAPEKKSYYHLFLSNPYYLIFNLTTSFQAVSTAYWIAFCLHYGEWNKKQFPYYLFLCNLVIVSNWFWYNCDDIFSLGIGLIKISMKYRYIEGLFIMSSWVPLLFKK
jgi:hypothetical protein